MQRIGKGFITSIIVLLLLAAMAWAALPQTINYQGYLTNADGTPVNTAVNVTFSLYSSNPARNNPAWRDTRNVTPANGVYSVVLGQAKPITASFDVPYWLGVQVESDPEMTPLQPLAASPYAFRAATADSVGSGALADGSVSTMKLADGSVTAAKLADGIVTDAKISGPISAANGGTGVTTGLTALNASNLASGTVPDIRLSNNVDLLSATQNISGQKTYSSPIISTVAAGTAPLSVASTTLVPNLNAGMVGGQKLADLDLRYGTPSAPNPTLQQIAALRWDLVRSADLTVAANQPAGLAFDGASVWVANIGSSNVMKLSPATGAIIGAYAVGNSPGALVFDGSSVWVANNGSNNVTKLNPATGAIIGTYTVGTYPQALTFDGGSVWVANYSSNNVMKLSSATGAIIGAYAVGAYPGALAFDGASVWVANSGSNNVMKLNPATGAIVGAYAVGTYPIALAFDGVSVWVANSGSNNVMKLNPATGAIVGTYAVGDNPAALAFDGASVWVANINSNNVMKLNPATGAIVGTYAVGGNPAALTFDGASVWVANLASNNVTKLVNAGIIVGDQAVGTAQLVKGSVTAAAIADGSVTTAAIADNSITDAKITGPISSAKLDLSTVVKKAGDTMAGTLTLPANGLAVGTNQLVASGGMVGIGTAAPNEQLELTGNLRLPATTVTTGIIRSGANTLLHAYGVTNLFAGIGAGNLTMTGSGNTASGSNALSTNISGSSNTANGSSSLNYNSTGSFNTANGSSALLSNSTGSYNTASGSYALINNTTASRNTAVGVQSLTSQSYSNGGSAWNSFNTAVGFQALYANQPTSTSTGVHNTALGASALYSSSSGHSNTAVGRSAGYTNNTGYGNSFLGYGADVLTNNLSNATAIGYNAKVGANNSMALGGTGFDAVKVGIGTSTPGESLDVMGNVRINDRDIYLRNDTNHGLGWYGNIKLFAETDLNGPALYGDTGGALGTTRGGEKIALSWNSSGNVSIPGTLSKGSGSFKIDHPLDPQNKYLYHSFVESPDMMNIYNGNVVTDDNGYATVELPEWFEALNREFRYQLTILDEGDSGDFVQSKVVRGVSGNRFTIRTSAPVATVSWQVTGIRKDAYAEAHRIQVEEEKPVAERGACLHPEACESD